MQIKMALNSVNLNFILLSIKLVKLKLIKKLNLIAYYNNKFELLHFNHFLYEFFLFLYSDIFNNFYVMLDFEFRSQCPISSALDIFGDKWSLVIIRDLFIGRNTYSEFLKSPEKISTNILVDRIKKLRSHGILDFKRDVNDNKIKYYYLTDSGIDLFPMIMNLSLWSRKHLHVVPGPFSKKDYGLIDLNGLDSFLKETTSKYLKTRETILN
ncbi:MAG TPA: hypothetical protein DEQ63_07220 [Flavobacteriaceae bacterium]|nr:hypothetical protein [Flavobacteriaceae bacterium]